MKFTLLLLTLALAGCGSEKDRANADYLAAVKRQQAGYCSNDAQRAYVAELQFIDFVKERQRTGGYLPNPDVLVWEYPRLALAAEYCGRQAEAAHIFAQAERYARTVYPHYPPDKTSAAALRAAIDKMTTVEQSPWKQK